MPRPSFRKAKAPLGMPEHSLEGGSTTEGCKHGHFKLVGSPKRKNYTDPGGGCRTRRQQLRVLVSQTEVSRLSHCLSMYTDPALASLDSTLRAIPLLPPPSRPTLPCVFCKRREVNMTSFSRCLVFLVVAVDVLIVLQLWLLHIFTLNTVRTLTVFLTK